MLTAPTISYPPASGTSSDARVQLCAYNMDQQDQDVDEGRVESDDDERKGWQRVSRLRTRHQQTRLVSYETAWSTCSRHGTKPVQTILYLRQERNDLCSKNKMMQARDSGREKEGVRAFDIPDPRHVLID